MKIFLILSYDKFGTPDIGRSHLSGDSRNMSSVWSGGKSITVITVSILSSIETVMLWCAAIKMLTPTFDTLCEFIG